MRDEDKRQRDYGQEWSETEREDARWQSAILGLLLELYPAPFTRGDLATALLQSNGSFAERDAFQRAVNELIGYGLVVENGIFLTPSRAAVRFQELETG